MSQKRLIKDIKLTEIDNFFCESCQLRKSHHLLFKKKERIETHSQEKSYTQTCVSVESLDGSGFFVTFKDNGFDYVYFLKHKSDVFTCLRNSKN